MELHRIIGKYCDDYGHSRFEEGSEHFFAYTFEHVTGRTLAHHVSPLDQLVLTQPLPRR